MTDQERLATAEEIVARTPPLRMQFKGFFVQHGGVRWYAYRGMSGLDTLASSDKLLDCALEARQKLAAEREAARTPEERRLMAALKEVMGMTHGSASGTWGRQVYEVAEKALEQGAQ